MADWTITRLNKSHDRQAFSCGKASLDDFLHHLVTQYEKRRLGRTYVAIDAGSTLVAGFYALAAGSLDMSVLPEDMQKKLPRHPIPTIHIARLAVDLKTRGQGLGETLLMHALETAVDLSESLGVFGIDVWAIDDEASAFYEKYGFRALKDHPHHLFMSIKTAEMTIKS